MHKEGRARLLLLRGHARPDGRVARQLAEQAHDGVRARVVPREQQRQAQVLARRAAAQQHVSGARA
jgi:hypothetical protein